ncbi:AAA family ATPase [Nocardia fluminea]
MDSRRDREPVLPLIYHLLSDIDHSSSSNSRYSALEKAIAKSISVDPKVVYAAHISKTGNVSVRFGQSPRATKARVLVAITSAADPSEVTDALARYQLKSRSGAESITFFGRQKDDLSMGRPGLEWALFSVSVVARPIEPLIMPFIREQPEDLVINLLPDIGRRPVKRASPAKRKSPRFKVRESPGWTPSGPFPMVTLERDSWDDYGYKTSFHVTVHMSADECIPIGLVKIMKKGQEGGPTRMPEGVFDSLDETYASLGQSYGYYEELKKLLPDNLSKPILRRLRDVVTTPSVRDNFENSWGFQRSLVRMGTAARALEDAPALFRSLKKKRDAALSFTFTTTTGGREFSIDFEFNQSGLLPDRINAVIGYNGTGKTQLLANLAFVALGDTRQSGPRYGYIHGGQNFRFSCVIAISYSAFDTFMMPQSVWDIDVDPSSSHEFASGQSAFGYSYCGLRTAGPETDGFLRSDPTSWTLKGTDDIADEFAIALEMARRRDARPVLSHALHALGADPSFERINIDVDDAVSEYTWQFQDRFKALSTGHKIVINIVVQIVARAQPGSLILIDEPESHLHPSLLAAFMKALNIILDYYDSYAVITTHSPVVLQEIPKRYVRVLKRAGDHTRVDEASEETFGANVGTLTRNVFNLDSSQTDFHSVLEKLAQTMSLDEIDELFDNEMSSQARAYVMALQRGAR